MQKETQIFFIADKLKIMPQFDQWFFFCNHLVQKKLKPVVRYQDNRMDFYIV